MLINRKQTNIISKFWLQIDKVILCSVLALLCIGMILVITASPFVAFRIGVEPTYFIYRQLIYVVVALLIMFIIPLINIQLLSKIAILGMVVSLLAMLAAIGIGSEVKGAKRWIYILGFSLQGSEFAKVFFPLCVAFLIQYYTKVRKDTLYIYIMLFAFYMLFVFLLLLEPDVGTTVFS